MKIFMLFVYFIGVKRDPVTSTYRTEEAAMAAYQVYQGQGGHFKLYEIDIDSPTIKFVYGCK